MIEADLHIHTTASDGEYTPAEILAAARRLKLKAIAITDHDSVDNTEKALEAGVKAGLQVIPGVEISCVYSGEEIHILGYFMDIKDRRLRELLGELRQSRHHRLERMLSKANKMGFRLKPEDIEYDGVPGRAHLGRALVKKGYVRDMTEAFSRYLKLGGPLYVERYHISPREIMEVIRGAGGVTSLAHPGLLRERKLVGEMISHGVEGLEVFYPLHTRKQVKEFKALAEKHDLALTGGSDFHGPGSNTISLAAAGVSLEQVRALEIRIKK